MPVRKIPRSYSHVTGMVASDKLDRLIGYESRPERYFIKHTEFNPNVKFCEEQPVKIPYTMNNGKQSHYTPDFLVHFVNKPLDFINWRPLLVEVKPRKALFKDWSILHKKFLAARDFARKNEWEFTIISEKELVTPYLDNITFLTRYRNYTIDQSDQNMILETLNVLTSTSPNFLLKSITSDKESTLRLISVIWNLLATHKIWTDLEIPLSMNSIIRPATSENTDERIYSLCAGRMGHARWRALRYYA